MSAIYSRAALLAEGVPARTVDHRIRRGVYTRLLPGIYCLGETTALDRATAVVAWLPDAHLSHRTAAWLWGMLDEPELTEATVPLKTHRRTPPWLRLYRRSLPGDAFDTDREVPLVSPAQALVDCAGVLPAGRADRLVDAHLGPTVPRREVLELCRRGGWGTTAARRQLHQAATNAFSEPERRFARVLARRGLFPTPNLPVGPYVGDLVDECSRTIIEIDGWEYHNDRQTFRKDRRRQNWLVRNGWFVLRYAAGDILDYGDACADEVEQVLRARRRRFRARTWR